MKKIIYLPSKFDTLNNNTLHQSLEKVKRITKENLEGIYHLENNSLKVTSSAQIKILKRKNISKSKSSLFIAWFENGKFSFYISSLYFILQSDGKEKYRFDFQGKEYFLILDIEKKQAEIKKSDYIIT
jgi:hypothetical protein